MLILLILWMTWLFRALLAYWGARRTASRALIVFGSFWAVFVGATIVGALSGPEALQLVGVLMGLLVVAPFFALAWAAGRWPRPTGAALLVPPIASGLALLRERPPLDDEAPPPDLAH